MKTLVTILLVLTSQPLWGWTVPFQGSGEAPEVVEDLKKGPDLLGRRENPGYVAFDYYTLEETDGSAPIDIDLEIEETDLEQDAEGMRGPPDTEEDEEDEEGSGENDRDESNEIIRSSTAAPKKQKKQSFPTHGILPNALQDIFDRAPSVMEQFYKKERSNILRLETELNSIIIKALNAMARFNGTTTNTTDVVQDDEGHKFKVQTLIKKGDKNQTLIMETIETLTTPANRTKRANWLAEPAQKGEAIH